MATVTKLSRAKRGPGKAHRIDLELDGEPFGVIHENIVAEFLLFAGKELNRDDLAALENRSMQLDALAFCHASIARRAQTRHELAGKLHDRGLAPDVVDAALVRCEELGLLNDDNYARSYVTSRLGRGHGPHRIRHDLARRGIAAPTIAVAIEAGTAAMSTEHACRVALEKKYRNLDLGDPVVAGKASRFLQRRGFSYSDISAAMRAVRT